MAKRKTIEQEEKDSTDRSLNHLIPDGKMVVVEYADKVDRPYTVLGEFDVIIAHMSDNNGFNLGVALSRSRDALKSRGLLLLDYYGNSIDIEQIINVSEFVGIKYVSHDEKNAALVFQKVPITIDEQTADLEQVED